MFAPFEHEENGTQYFVIQPHDGTLVSTSHEERLEKLKGAVSNCFNISVANKGNINAHMVLAMVSLKNNRSKK